ncbi:MAG: type II secretion system protein [Phycisphaerae bacterium]|nr:type II secretion system protein [Phycisphaerae bacterium]
MRSIPVPTCRRMTRRKGFTLIELLVVIAILSLLVSILLPSLQNAKNLAKETVCQSNQHNVFMAHTFYAEDNGNWQVAVAAKPADGSLEEYLKQRWYWRLTYLEYLSEGPEGGDYTYNSLAIRCPLHGELGRRNCYYARNYYAGIASFRTEDVIHPADKILIGDSFDSWDDGIGGCSYVYFGVGAEWYWDTRDNPHGRHTSGKALFAFMDGHGGSYSEKEKEYGLEDDLSTWRIPCGYNYGGGFIRDSASE